MDGMSAQAIDNVQHFLNFGVTSLTSSTNIKFQNCGAANQFASIALSEKEMLDKWINTPAGQQKDDFYTAWLNDDAAKDKYKSTSIFQNYFGGQITSNSLEKQFQAVYRVVCGTNRDYTGALLH